MLLGRDGQDNMLKGIGFRAVGLTRKAKNHLISIWRRRLSAAENFSRQI